MLKHILLLISSLLIFFSFAACGSGGGSTVANNGPPPGNNPVPITPQPGAVYTKATLKISVAGSLPVSKAISGAGFTLFFPHDLTPAMTNGNVAAGVVTLSGAFAGGILAETVYTPAATATSFGKILITLADTSQTGVTQVGEMAQITLQLANGAAPTTGSFILTSNGVIDMEGKPLATVTTDITDVILQ